MAESKAVDSVDLDWRGRIRNMTYTHPTPRYRHLWTRANVAEIALDKGWEQVEIDGQVTGFNWKEPDVQIGGTVTKGRFIMFDPLTNNEPRYV